VNGFDDFHFLRPLWLLAIAALLPLLWRAARTRRSAGAWERVCDPELLEQLLVPGSRRAVRLPALLLALGWTAACVALAGPTWERLPQTSYRSPTQTIAVLDLSESMLARDVAPSRLVRARFELLDLLDRVEGAVGLVIFSDEPYAVTPLTDDPRVIAELVPTLSPDLMPGRGKRLDRAIDRARELLEQAGAPHGRVVVLSDGLGSAPEAARDAARRSADAGYQVSALGLGEGAEALESLVRLGGGHYAPVTTDDSDVERVLATRSDGANLLSFGDAEQASVGADVWRDEGPWLALIPLLLAPFAFRKGWASALVLLFAIGLQAPRAEAAEGTLFQRADERGAEAFAEGRHAEAADLFEDPEWRAAALYRSGDYEGAVASLHGRTDPDSLYNRGNALARSGRLEEAIESYDQVLEQNPDNEDAAYNRELVKSLLEQQQQQQQESQSQQDQASQGSGDSDSRSGDDGKSSDGSDEGDASQDSKGSGSQDQGSQGEDSGGEADASPGDASKSPSGSEPQTQGGDESAASSGAGGESSEGAQDDASEAGGSEASSASDAQASNEPAAEPPEAEPAAPGAAAEASPGEDSGEDSRSASSPGKLASRPNGEAASESGAAAGVDPRGEGAEADPGAPTVAGVGTGEPLSESDQEIEQWLNRVPDDPGGLLREKLRRRYAERRYRTQLDAPGSLAPGGRTR